MSETGSAGLWDLVRGGRHVLVRGEPPRVPPGWTVVEVRCDGEPSIGGPLAEASRRVREALGTPASRARPSRRRSGVSRRLLGEDAPAPAEASLVEVCNRLAAESTHPSALLLRGLDRADEATVHGLVDILRRPQWLVLPLVLHVTRPDAMPELDEVVTAAGGAVVEAPAAELREPQSVQWDWHGISAEALQVLRAGASVGPVFEIDIVARLLDLAPLRVLERLQEAADAGAPLIDRGHGRFSLPGSVMSVLRDSMLPSLLAAWHARIAEIMLPPAPQPPAAAAVEAPAGAAATPPPAIAGYADAFAGRPGARRSGGAEIPALEGIAPSVRPGPARDEPPAGAGPYTDEAQAAAHLAEAGRIEDAVEGYLAAARRLSDEGDARRARWMLERAASLLDRVPSRASQALLQARMHMALAQVQWHGSGTGAFSLQDALRSLEAARAVIPDDASAGLIAELAALRAGVCYDLGDLGSLQEALEELSTASRTLLAAGEALDAARLLNDQAAINLRLGDPVQAVNLLSRSRELFERVHQGAPDDPTALEELAQTEHLLARVPLHAQMRPGREVEAIDMALEHARSAERIYGELAHSRERGRLSETMARLELARGRLDAAAGHLSRAIDLQKKLGDATGLARSAAAYSDLLVAAGRPTEAVSPLADSIALNYEKGSRIGLAFNRSALQTLRAALADTAPSTHSALRTLETNLAAAEAVLGRAELPQPMSP